MSEIDTRALAQVLVGTADEEIVRLEARLASRPTGRGRRGFERAHF